MTNKKKKTAITANMQAIRLASKEETPRLCTCGSGEEAYLCNGLPEEGWAYCGQILSVG